MTSLIEAIYKKLSFYLKLSSMIATVLGTYYLLVFCYNFKIPFPLSLKTLPSILLAIGIICISITALLIFYFTMSVVVLSEPARSIYMKNSNLLPQKLKNKKNIPAPILNYFLYFIIPLITILFYLFFAKKLNLSINYLLFYLFTHPALYSFYIITRDYKLVDFKNWKKELSIMLFVKNYILYLYLFFFSISSYILFYIFFVRTHIATETSHLAIATILFTLLNFATLHPKRLNLINKKTIIDNKIDAHESIINHSTTHIYFICFIISLWPTIAFNISKVPFKLLNIGGEISKQYYFAQESKKYYPDFFIKNCEDQVCYSYDMNVVLELGESIYVKSEKIKKGYTFSFPRQYLFEIIKDE